MSVDAAHGSTARTLHSLLMDTGNLSKILTPEEVQVWAGLAEFLRKSFEGFVATTDRKTLADTTADLCTAYYAHNKPMWFKESDYARQTDGLSEAVIGFLETFMVRNGQWDYLRNQDWFTDNQYVVAVEANYYPDRTGSNERPAFHKDSAGINVFANLIFANTRPMEATEWFADLEEPSAKRAQWQQRNVPAGYLKDLAVAREALRGKDTGPVSGGVTGKEYTYVSWVDDLVWHSTPAPRRRVPFTVEDAQRAYPVLVRTFAGDFGYVDRKLEITVLGAELARSFADDPETLLHEWATRNKQPVRDLESAKNAWAAVYQGNGGKARFDQDVETRGRKTWRITGGYAIANSQDPNLPGSETLLETPAGLSNRERSNSLDENRQTLEAVRGDNVGVPRSFIRTWVRLVRHNSTELTT
ncbi:hypothetical protein ACWEFJ_25690 [Actinosynnema sp. NPDC004786]